MLKSYKSRRMLAGSNPFYDLETVAYDITVKDIATINSRVETIRKALKKLPFSSDHGLKFALDYISELNKALDEVGQLALTLEGFLDREGSRLEEKNWRP